MARDALVTKYLVDCDAWDYSYKYYDTEKEALRAKDKIKEKGGPFIVEGFPLKIVEVKTYKHIYDGRKMYLKKEIETWEETH